MNAEKQTVFGNVKLVENCENINSYLFHRTDIPNLQFNFTVQLPKLTFNGKYSLKMRLLLLNIQGKGPISGVLGNYMKLIHIF